MNGERKFKDVVGLLSPEDQSTLEVYAGATADLDGDAIEIGSYKGLSAITILMSLPKNKKLISVDINNYGEFQNAIDKYNLAERSNKFTVNFKNYDFSKNLYSFVFIDHNHEYQDNLDCFNMVLPYVVRGGYVLFHDVGHPDYPGVELAINRIEKDCSGVKLILRKFTSVFQKL